MESEGLVGRSCGAVEEPRSCLQGGQNKGTGEIGKARDVAELGNMLQ